MKSIKPISFFLILLIFNLNSGICQVWTGSQPMYYNPSFAGSGEGPRIAYLTKYTFTSGPRDYFRLYNDLSGDFFISKISTGIGIKTSFGNEKALNNNGYWIENYKAFSAGLVIAPKISLKGKYTISPGFEYNYNYQNLNVDIFQSITQDFDVAKTHHISGYKASLLFNSKKFYLGYTLNIYNRGPKYVNLISRRYIDEYLPSSYKQTVKFSTIQTGFSFQKNEKSNFSITPQLVLNIGNEYGRFLEIRQMDVNVRYKKLLTGLTFREEKTIASKENLGFIIGAQTKNLRIALITCRRFNLWGGTSFYKNIYSSSISIRYQFKNKNSEIKQNNFISQK